MSAARSLTIEQLWADKDSYARAEWFEKHGDRIARARGQAVLALDALARVIKETGAHDDKVFSADKFIESALNSTDWYLAPEVREWLGA